jgi:hypothetical protein
MKSKTLIYIIGVISGIILSIIGAFLYFIWAFNQPCSDPDKPLNVPTSAIWAGDCDGGNWIELVDIKKDTVRFRIYRDWNGELILDANFVYENCNGLQLTNANWNEYIAYFDNALHIYSKFQTGNSYCQLVPVFPAYYEEKIE